MATKSSPGAPGVREPQADPELFSTLVASRPKSEGRTSALASVVSVAVHVGVVALLFWATMNVGEAEEPDNTIVFDLVPEVKPEPVAPPPPAPLPEDVAPEIDMSEVAPGFIAVPTVVTIPPDIPPPAVGSTFDARDYSGTGEEGGRADGTGERVVTAEDVDAAPAITPFTVAPRIQNRDEVMRALQRFYPPLLRDAGIGDTVVIWIRIDAEGEVVRTQVHQPSGHASLDDAALRVGEIIEFSPAMNRDRAIAVWVQWPIAFVPR